jgi:PAS domain S-box-containing protein
MEKTFIKSEERLRLSQKAARVISWDWDIKTGELNWLGDIKEIFGNIATKDIATFEKFMDFIHADDQKVISNKLEYCISNKKEFWVEHRIIKNDGSLCWVEEIGKIQYDKNEKPRKLVGITHDITREKRWEELQNKLNQEIHKERDLLKIIMENTDAQLAYLDPHFNFIDVNSSYAEHSGFTKEEIIGKNHFDLFPNEENKAIFEKVKETKEKTEFEAKPFQLPHSNEISYWNWSLNPILNKRNQVNGFVLSLIDVTEIKKNEEQIKQLNNSLMKRTTELAVTNNELEAFTYSASHDLQAPLRSISGFSEIMLEDYEDNLDDQGKDYLHRICKAISKMSQLINDLLKLSRISRAEMKKEPVNISELTEEIITEYKKKEPTRTISIDVEPNIVADGDKNLLRIVLNNLIGNSWKFTKNQTNPKISFGKTKKEGNTVYYVQDNGAGFDEDYADKLFVPFQRLHDEQEFPGSGIGLPLVARIIHRHNGEIWANGEVGKGATFYFSLTTLS